MSDIPLEALFATLVILLLLSGFFSSSETGMMALNRYRLKHLVKKQNKGAIRATELLERPDRLIGVILIGNNLVNILASAIATVIALRLFGDAGIAVATVLLTIVMLIFSEVTPKTIAALRPEKIAFPASLVLRPLLTALYPAVWLINHASNGLARLFGVNPEHQQGHEHLRPEELRTVVDEAGDLIPDQHQKMLLNILDLETATVEDIMIPRNEVEGLDLQDDIPTLLRKIRCSEYTRMPVFEGDINKIVGILHLRNAARFLYGEDREVTHDAIKRFAREPYFVPLGTPLHTQLLNFQKHKHRIAIVVDEYGDVQGIATMEDLLEEIVGEFTTNLAEDQSDEIVALEDGWYLIEGSTSVRDVNRGLHWELPTDGPKTLNGVMLEYLENIPDGNSCFQIGSYRFETVSLSEKVIDSARVKSVVATAATRQQPELF
ncbi:HlyC/CorC family transporter [Gilvimarinus sp. F26214L]|uniref:HlyC/CorC family transporter n=1 Tax=Gilvimarinus sp. DZF01 TaxID=3461371 RepID=UPI0040466CF6